MSTSSYELKLPLKHAFDWVMRLKGEMDGGEIEVRSVTSRSIALGLNELALRDLISDSIYYSEEMGQSNTGDVDYRPAARRCIAAIEKAGVRYERRGFSITLIND